MSNWISVEDKIPMKKDLYLVYSQWPNSKPFRCVSDYTKDNGFAVNYVTHWMSLPEAPNK